MTQMKMQTLLLEGKALAQMVYDKCRGEDCDELKDQAQMILDQYEDMEDNSLGDS
ncbi:hypothetical protein KAR91_47500 [Candidatus Pacearchaeota archaeon]|nr:hypothetical protein [Candidatus Pacearchaeota archaeon]